MIGALYRNRKTGICCAFVIVLESNATFILKIRVW